MSKKDKAELLGRYEQMLRDGKSMYFDTDELEDIAVQYEEDNRISEALQVVEHGLSLHPFNSELSLRKARYLLCLDRPEDAEKVINTVPGESTEAILIRAELLLINGEAHEGEKLLDSLLRSDDVTIELCFEVLDLYLDYSCFDELVRFVNHADDVLPDSRELLRELALVHEDRLDYEAALAIYDRLIDKDPYSPADWFSMAKIYALQKEYDKSIEACDFALTTKENDETIISFKGYCFYDSGRYPEAIEQFKEFAGIIKDKAVAYELIAECYMKLEKNNEAVEYLLLALELDPSNPNICYQLATNYYDMGNITSAIEYLHNTIRLDENDAEAFSFLGELELRDGLDDLAEMHLSRSLELDGDDEETIALIADLRMKQERWEDAAVFYEQLSEKKPYQVKYMFKLIMIYYNLEQEDKVELFISRIDDLTMDESIWEKVPEDDRNDLLNAKNMLQNLKEVLRDNLDENI